MKKLTWILFSSYLGLFVILGVVFYYKYLDSYLLAGAEPAEVEVVGSELYYSAGNNLYRIDPDHSKVGSTVNSSERLQSTGEVLSLDQSSDSKKVVYSSKNKSGNTEIWQVELSSNQSEIISQDEITADYVDFTNPIFSPDSQKVAFWGTSEAASAIFMIDADQITKELIKSQTKILAYDWSPDGKNLVYCTADGTCNLISALSRAIQGSFKAVASQIAWINTQTIVYLENVDNTANIYSIKVGETTPSKITNTSSPKTISFFDVDRAGQVFVYQVNEGTKTDIYTVKFDGSNPIQLSTDQKSFSPVISPDGQRVAFIKQEDGIYMVKTDTTGIKKILNLTEIDRLLGWR